MTKSSKSYVTVTRLDQTSIGCVLSVLWNIVMRSMNRCLLFLRAPALCGMCCVQHHCQGLSFGVCFAMLGTSILSREETTPAAALAEEIIFRKEVKDQHDQLRWWLDQILPFRTFSYPFRSSKTQSFRSTKRLFSISNLHQTKTQPETELPLRRFELHCALHRFTVSKWWHSRGDQVTERGTKWGVSAEFTLSNWKGC